MPSPTRPSVEGFLALLADERASGADASERFIRLAGEIDVLLGVLVTQLWGGLGKDAAAPLAREIAARARALRTLSDPNWTDGMRSKAEALTELCAALPTDTRGLTAALIATEELLIDLAYEIVDAYKHHTIGYGRS
jgi:hypothetical protein